MMIEAILAVFSSVLEIRLWVSLTIKIHFNLIHSYTTPIPIPYTLLHQCNTNVKVFLMYRYF